MMRDWETIQIIIMMLVAWIIFEDACCRVIEKTLLVELEDRASWGSVRIRSKTTVVLVR